MIPNALLLPNKYFQGKGLLGNIGKYVTIYGKRPMIVWEGFLRDSIAPTLIASFQTHQISMVDALFSGETTRKAVDDLLEKITTYQCDVVIGIGGGKVIDAAKGAAAKSGLRCIIVPTIASNDAPTSACTVWYHESGEYDGFDLWNHNPDMILVDTEIIAKAPVRFFVAGMGDALATWPEARAAHACRASSCAGGTQTLTAMAMAKLCFETIMTYGREAKAAVEVHVVTPAVEKVVEANILLSGAGWESGGLATAHAIANSLPAIHETHGLMHGEKVAFGLITQLCLEPDIEMSEIYNIVDFMVDVGLPITFAQMNMENVTRERLFTFAESVSGDGSFTNNHHFSVGTDDIVAAMFAADSLGKRRQKINKFHDARIT